MMLDDDRTDFVRARQILESVTDGTLLVLKGHLLIEDALYKLVCTKLYNPKFLARTALRFTQLLSLARLADYTGPHKIMWATAYPHSAGFFPGAPQMIGER
jgi:hypothetical protein